MVVRMGRISQALNLVPIASIKPRWSFFFVRTHRESWQLYGWSLLSKEFDRLDRLMLVS